MKRTGREEKNRKIRKSQSMMYIAIQFMIPVCMLFLLLFVFMFESVDEAREMSYRYMQDMAAANATRVNEDISKINSEIVYLIQQDKDIDSLPCDITPDMTAYYKLLEDIVSLNKILRIRYGGKYFFYEYVVSADFLILDNHLYFPMSTKSELALGLKEMIKGYLSGQTERSEWNFFLVRDDIYLFCFYEVKGKVVGCIISLDDLFSNFNISNLGYEGIPFFVTESGEVVMQQKEQEKRMVMQALEKGFAGSTVHSYQLGRIGQLNLLIAPTEGILDRIVILQFVSTALAVGIILIIIMIAFGYYRRILTPMHQFVRKLSDPEEEKWLHNIEDNRIMELEMASKEFREMMRQIQSLKIAVYEKELLHSRTELEYVQEQIRPHFYLNCISVIHGMAEMHHAEDILEISEKLSDYLRYVINDSYALRQIRQEVAHIRDYIAIQKLRYEDFFQFEVIMDEGVEECLIPPLVLQVFVENAINHGVTFERTVEITLYIVAEKYRGEDYLYICISDTGEGFTDEALYKIKNNKSIEYNGRKHVGIQNTLKRLEIMYGDKAEINFFNMTEHCGAVVEIRIPAKRE